MPINNPIPKEYFDTTESNIRGGTESLETIKSAVAAVQNNTRFTAAVPIYMNKPDAGNLAFKHSTNLYDSAGNMEDPTNNEIIVRVVKNDGSFITANLYKENALTSALDSATDQVNFPTANGWRAMEKDAVGKYFFFYKVASDETEETLNMEFGWEEDGNINFQFRSTEVADVHGDIAAIKLKTDNLPTDPADQSEVASAITTAHTATDADIATVDCKADTILTETQSHPTLAEIEASAVLTLKAQLVNGTGDIVPPENKGLWDYLPYLDAAVSGIPTTPTLQAMWTDAKAGYLDEAISAAKTLTVAERTAIRKSVCLTGDTASSIGKILFDLNTWWKDGGRLDLLIDGIKTETDKLKGGKYTETISAGTNVKTLIREITTTSLLEIKSIWLDLSNLVTAGATIELEHKIDGTNYKVFETDSWALSDDPGVLITGFTIDKDFKISITGGEAAGVNITYKIIYKEME